MDALNEHNHDRLMDIAVELSAQVYSDHQEHYLMHQLSALIRKFPSAQLKDASPEEAALETFFSGESQAKRTNERVLLQRNSIGLVDPSWDSHIHRMRRYISRVLARVSLPSDDGPAVMPDVARILSECRFTGGASLGVHGNATNILRKLHQGANEGWTCTPSALPYFVSALWENPTIRDLVLSNGDGGLVCYDKHEFVRRVHLAVRLVDHNKIAFVPKTALTHRIVGAEPSGNGYVQKGTDTVLRDALRLEGLDLTDQETNCRMAASGSLRWKESDPYCTIDLTNASGCLALLLVEETFSDDWFQVLSAIRCRYYLLPNGRVGMYECFGSMGNGTVFPLQTLVYAAICNSVCEANDVAPDFRVYGDDIIVRKSVFSQVVQALQAFGFQPNLKKTFGEGPFRESCGGDYHSGVNVRPVYLTNEVSSLETIFRFHNQSLRRESYVQKYFAAVRRYLRELVPKNLRFVTDYDPERPLPKGLHAGKRATFDAAFWGASDEVMLSSMCSFNRDTYSWGYTLLTVEAVIDDYSDDKIDSEVANAALLLTALSGGSSSKPFTLRYNARYKPVRENWPVPRKGIVAVFEVGEASSFG